MNSFLGEVRMFAGNFAPRGWAFCDGQLLNISDNQALFSLIGTYYGGDGRATFGLPDLRGRAPVASGTGPGLPPIRQGDKKGSPQKILTQPQMPSHTHKVSGKILATDSQADTHHPDGAAFAKDRGTYNYRKGASTTVDMQADSIAGSLGNTGQGQPFSNHQPSLGIQYIISLGGNFPSRS